MSSTSTAKIPLRSVLIQRAEGPHGADFRPHTVASYDDATQLLATWSETASAAGGYHKCDFTLTFADGETYRGRYDLVHHSADSPDLRRHVQDYLLAHSGRWCPPSRTWDQHRAILARFGDAFAEQCAYWLDHYEI